MRRPRRTSLRTSRTVVYIPNARSFYWISLTLHYLMSFGLGVGIPMWETCALSSVPQFVTWFRGTRIVVTPDLVAEVLRVLRVALPNYPGCDCLWTMSRDKLISHFCGTPSIWGGKLNTPCSGFAKGLRFLNMVMTFTLTPLSHYNSIIELRAYFLLSLMEGPTIDFPSLFITSIIDVYQGTATHDKLIFPSAIMRTFQHFSIPVPLSPLFTVMGAISTGSVQQSEAQLQLKRPHVETIDPAAPVTPPSSALSSSAPSTSVAGYHGAAPKDAGWLWWSSKLSH